MGKWEEREELLCPKMLKAKDLRDGERNEKEIDNPDTLKIDSPWCHLLPLIFTDASYTTSSKIAALPRKSSLSERSS